METMLKMDCEDAIKYIEDNVKVYDDIELSYHRVFTPGEVLCIDNEDRHGKKSFRIMVQVAGDLIAQAVEVDLEEIKDDLVEIKHIPKDKNDSTVITIEKCDTDSN
ncbi:MAG: DUF2097 domain-containing protein [Methanobacterium sp.]